MEYEFPKAKEPIPSAGKDDLIVIAGAGCFIAGNLAAYFRKKGFTRIRAVDKIFLETDGESLGHTPFTFEVVQQCLRIVTGDTENVK